MSENVGLQALSKLEDTIMKIIDLILKLIDRKEKQLQSEKEALKGENEKLSHENERLQDLLDKHGIGYKEPKDGKSGDSIDEITVSQQIENNEKKIEANEKKIENIENVQGSIRVVQQPGNMRKLAEDIVQNPGQDVAKAVENAIDNGGKSMQTRSQAAEKTANDLSKANEDKDKGTKAKSTPAKSTQERE